MKLVDVITEKTVYAYMPICYVPKMLTKTIGGIKGRTNCRAKIPFNDWIMGIST
jgi:hypothetical protein